MAIQLAVIVAEIWLGHHHHHLGVRVFYLQKSAGLWYGGHLNPALDNAGIKYSRGPLYRVRPLASAYTVSIFSKRSAEGWWIVATTVRPPRARLLRRAMRDADAEESNPLEKERKYLLSYIKSIRAQVNQYFSHLADSSEYKPLRNKTPIIFLIRISQDHKSVCSKTESLEKCQPSIQGISIQ